MDARRKNVFPQMPAPTYSRIRPAFVPIRPFGGAPMPCSTRNCGMMPRNPGSISVNRYTRNSTSRPKKSMRANP